MCFLGDFYIKYVEIRKIIIIIIIIYSNRPGGIHAIARWSFILFILLILSSSSWFTSSLSFFCLISSCCLLLLFSSLIVVCFLPLSSSDPFICCLIIYPYFKCSLCIFLIPTLLSELCCRRNWRAEFRWELVTSIYMHSSSSCLL